MAGCIFNDGHLALCRTTENKQRIEALQRESDVYRSEFDRLNVDNKLVYSFENLVYLLREKSIVCERKMFASEFKQTATNQQLEIARQLHQASEKRYNDLVEMMKSTTQQNATINKKIDIMTKKYEECNEKLTVNKRKLDAALLASKEVQFELSQEQEKRRKMRGIYSTFTIAFGSEKPTPAITEALKEFQAALKN